MNVLMCPGQGAQRVGMGKDLADRFPAARDAFAAIDDALDTRLSRIMWHGPESELTQTHNTQPAILAHSIAVLAVVGNRLSDSGAAAGHSLGEYSAHVAAGTLSAVDAARLVRRRGELMFAAGEERPGAMAAVLGLPTAEVQSACDEASGPDGLAVPANLNAPDQTVISGDPSGVTRAGERCKARGAKRVIPLKVSGAFHSPLMAPVAEELAEAFEKEAWRDARVPIVSNVAAEPITDASRIRALLAEQVRSPVEWVACVERMAVEGVTIAVECGPGSALTGMVKRIAPDLRVANVADGAGLEAASALLTGAATAPASV